MLGKHRIQVCHHQGDGHEGLCGLEKYHLTHPLGEGCTLYSATSRAPLLVQCF